MHLEYGTEALTGLKIYLFMKVLINCNGVICLAANAITKKKRIILAQTRSICAGYNSQEGKKRTNLVQTRSILLDIIHREKQKKNKPELGLLFQLSTG